MDAISHARTVSAPAGRAMAAAPGSRATFRGAPSRAAVAFRILHAVTALGAGMQVAIDARYENLIAVVLVVASSTATFLYVRGTRALHEVPLSTMAVLGLCVTTQWGALVAQSLLWDSLTQSLRVPLQTFSYLLGFQLVAIAAHFVSRRFRAFVAARRAGSDVVGRLGIFRVPSAPALWTLGVLGLLAILGRTAGEGNLLAKLADAFTFLAWAPFIIPVLAARFGPGYALMRRHWPPLVAYTLAVALLAVAVNARAIMLAGIVTAMLVFLLQVLDDERPFEPRHLRYLAVSAVVLALVYEPLSYFLTGMQAARAERGKISHVEMIKHTWAVLQDPAAVRRERTRAEIAAQIGAYDEYYFKTPMIGRLVETKFHDNGFFMVDGVSAVESRVIAQDAVDRVWSILPYPVLLALGEGRAKFVTFYSAGDLLANIRVAAPLGSFVTGSMFAQGIAIFGVWTPFLYFLLCVPVFVVWDMLARTGSGGAPAVVSVVGMLLMYRLFQYGIVTESIGNIAGVLLRFQLQNVLVFAGVFALTRIVWKPFEPPAALADRRGPGARA